MGNIYRILDCSSDTTFLTSLQDVLIEKFGEEVTIHAISGGYLIFSCHHISDRVIKINRRYGYYGSSYSSGANINDAVQFYSFGSDRIVIDGHIVLGDNFIFITSVHSNIIIAKTTGGRYIMHSSQSYNGHGAVNLSIDITNNMKFNFVDFDVSVMCGLNVPYKTTLLMSYVDTVGNTLLMNPDGTPDTIKDLFMSGYATQIADFLVTSTALFSRRLSYSNHNDNMVLRSSIVAEF